MSKQKGKVWNDRGATELQRIEQASQNRLKQASRRIQKAEAERAEAAKTKPPGGGT
jgi:hypothetical protein